MPSEGNSSPTFQWVSPVTFPPDSFFQIWFPSLTFSAAVSFGSVFGARLAELVFGDVVLAGFELAEQLNRRGTSVRESRDFM